jgi:hypothetical protein
MKKKWGYYIIIGILVLGSLIGSVLLLYFNGEI